MVIFTNKNGTNIVAICVFFHFSHRAFSNFANLNLWPQLQIKLILKIIKKAAFRFVIYAYIIMPKEKIQTYMLCSLYLFIPPTFFIKKFS